MNSAANQRISPARVVLILAVLMGIWLVFQFLPRERKTVLPLPPVAAESKLRSVGLTDNPDWEGLPDLFAVWTDQIPWVNDYTCFAYWHPGANAYAYVFEVTRGMEGIRFRRASAVESVRVPTGDLSLMFDVEELARYAGDRRAGSPTHPFVFPKLTDRPKPSLVVPKPAQGSHGGSGEQPLAKPIPTPISPPVIDLPKPSHAGKGQ